MTEQQEPERTEGAPKSEAADSPPSVWLTATEQDFAGIELNAPVSKSNSVDCFKLSNLYREAANKAAEDERHSEHRAYAMIGALCSFHFKPNEPNEPFGPMVRMSNGRSPIPDDFRGEPEKALLTCAVRFTNPAVRARVNDMLWILNRARAEAAQNAVSAYVEIVRHVRDGIGNFDFNEQGAYSHICAAQLRRALQIARMIGWDKPVSFSARRIVAELREQAYRNEHLSGFGYFANLDLDFAVSDVKQIAMEAEALAPKEQDLHRQYRLRHIAVRAYDFARKTDDSNRCRASAAECLVSISESNTESAMFQAHWLERAIAELYRLPGSHDRRRELKHRLVDVQTRIPDEMGSFHHEMDLTEIAQPACQAVADQHFMAALANFVRLNTSPSPATLHKQAEESSERFPLQALMSSTVIDNDGKPTHRYDDGDENTAIQRQIVQSETLRRMVVVNGMIEPARQTIMAEHQVAEQDLALLCHYSPFVPIGHEGVYMSGFARFFQGDMVGALHILVPQLENSIRHVLRSRGHDVIKLNNDMTQEDLNLSVVLDRLRPALDTIFGPALVTDIDNVFNHRGGPNIRNSVAHGHVTQATSFGPDAIYACWLILRICCLPLLPHWDHLHD